MQVVEFAARVRPAGGLFDRAVLVERVKACVSIRLQHAFIVGAEMKAASFEYIAVYYNRKRQHSTLGYQSPIQYLERWTSEQNQEKRAA